MIVSIDLKSIGFRISSKRKQLNITQEQLAEQMNVSIQMISNLERGNKAVKIDNLVKLCKILDVSTDYILTGNNTQMDASLLNSKLSELDPYDYATVELIIERLHSRCR